MKLNEIASSLPKMGFTQGSGTQMVEPNVLLSLRNVCQRGGKNPNTFELVVMCRLLQTLKDGTFYRQSNPFESNMSTAKPLMDLLRAMEPKDLCATAQRLNDLLAIKDADVYRGLANQDQEYLAWMKLFHAREANESITVDEAATEQQRAKLASLQADLNAIKGTTPEDNKQKMEIRKAIAELRKEISTGKQQPQLTEGLKSKVDLFTALDDYYMTKTYSAKQLDAPGISNETYGRKSCIYVKAKSAADRQKLEDRLTMNGFKVNKNYWPGSSVIEVQVSYFKGYNWDE